MYWNILDSFKKGIIKAEFLKRAAIEKGARVKPIDGALYGQGTNIEVRARENETGKAVNWGVDYYVPECFFDGDAKVNLLNLFDVGIEKQMHLRAHVDIMSDKERLYRSFFGKGENSIYGSADSVAGGRMVLGDPTRLDVTQRVSIDGYSLPVSFPLCPEESLNRSFTVRSRVSEGVYAVKSDLSQVAKAIGITIPDNLTIEQFMK